MNICVYGASSNAIDPKYIEAVELLGEKMGHLDDRTMHMVDEAISVSFGLGDSGTTV